MKTWIAFQAEQKKHRHRALFLLPTVFLAFEGMWTFWNLKPESAMDTAQGYLSGFYLLPMLHSLLYPIFLAVLANRLCDMEIKGDTRKLLYTLEKKKQFYNCKYIMALPYIAITAVGATLILWVAGLFYHFTDGFQWHMALQLTLSTCFVSATLFSIQQTLSLLSSNQILPLIVGLAGSFLSLFSLFFPPAAARLILWGYYGIFGFIQMDWEKSTRICTYYEQPFDWTGFLFFIIFSIAVFFFCRAVSLRKDV